MSKVKQMIPQSTYVNKQMAIADTIRANAIRANAIRANVKFAVDAYHNDKCIHAYIRLIELLLRDNHPQARVKSDGNIEFIIDAAAKEKIGKVQNELSTYAKEKYPMLFVKQNENY